MNKQDLNSKIINILASQKKYMTARELSDCFKVSEKTISRRISNINKSYSINIIVSVRGKGYKLSMSNWVMAQNNEPRTMSVQLRQKNILSTLLLKSLNSLSVNSLVNTYFISESVLQKDEKQISKIIKKWKLQLVHKNRSLRITGNEKDIRSALSEVVLNIDNAMDFSNLNTDKFEKINHEDFNFTFSQIDLAQKMLNASLPYPYNINLFSHIYILLNRVRRHNLVDTNLAKNNELISSIRANPDVFGIAKAIVNNVCKYLKITQNDLHFETYYLYEYLITSRLNFTNQYSKVDNRLAHNITLDYCNIVSKSLQIPSINNSEINNIENHILAMISRLKMHINLPNALLKNIKVEYKDVFNATKEAFNIISKKYNLPNISDNESGFICLYLAPFIFLQKQQKEKVRTIIICTTGVGTAQIISTKVEKLISDIEVVDMISLFDLKKVAHDKSIDLIISTVPIKKKMKVPVELVSALFTKQDEQKIKKEVERIKQSKTR